MKHLFEIRTIKKMSQVNLSVKIGVAQETISAYENGRSYPSVDTLLKLCEIFNVSADYLLDKTNISTPVNHLLVDNLNSKELEIIALYRDMPADKKERAIGMMIGLKE
jgi:transcriptional regulator with XRE-family HTH domain